ncbi:toxin-activating lysine-acyltransferase [Pseudaestuariivita atlantica]|uniref:toxin-activating lysine-acyltransferase n=1 Tax=Pseudaestuariivita atlantica TaxID=1317121 RepID=UPI00067B4ECD|nr:toxin-activating lysine-acyltransferase [Pseudaestuariivita atlantica]
MQINSEFPTPERLQAYGDLCFLYFRSDAHRDKSFALMRWIVQVPVDLGQYKIMYANDIPRAAFTFAMLNDAAEQKLLSGTALQPAEWQSGQQMWIMDVLAPYGQGSAQQVIRWITTHTPPEISSIRSLRPHGNGRMRMIELNRIDGPRWGARKLGEI